MPKHALAIYLAGNPALALTPTAHNERCEIPVRYADKGTPAQTGAVMTAKMGTGKIVLIGFRAQHRAQHRAQAYGLSMGRKHTGASIRDVQLLFNNLVD